MQLPPPLLRHLLLALTLPALAACSAIDFYWQGVNGQIDVLSRAQPIETVAATTPDPVLRERQGGTKLHDPWLWQLGDDVTLLAYGLSAVRAA